VTEVVVCWLFSLRRRNGAENAAIMTAMLTNPIIPIATPISILMLTESKLCCVGKLIEAEVADSVGIVKVAAVEETIGTTLAAIVTPVGKSDKSFSW
jgi:hypothetical protein